MKIPLIYPEHKIDKNPKRKSGTAIRVPQIFFERFNLLETISQIVIDPLVVRPASIPEPVPVFIDIVQDDK